MPVFGEFSQSVTVGGRPAYVRDLAIKESSSERVAAIDFVLEPLQVPGQEAAMAAAYIGEPVTVTQTVDGASQTWQVIITNVDERRNGAATFKRVQCRSLEYVASHTRFLDVWRRTGASTVVLQAWQRHTQGTPALRDVSLAGVATNNALIEEYASKYDSLYDLMEEVCLLTGWAWKVRDGVLYFFDPLSNPGPDLTQGSGATVRDTLQLKQSLEGVYNVYRGQGWSYRTFTIGRNFESFDCIGGFTFSPSLLDGVEVVGEPRIVQQKWRDMGLKVQNVDPDGIVELNKSILASNVVNGYLSVAIRVRGIHWVERFDRQSIELYGRRDAPPLSDNGGDNIRAVTRKLDELLKYRAYPAYDVTLDVVGVGWEPDQVVQTTLYDPAFSAPLYVTEVQRTTDGTDLNVSVTLTSPSEVVEGQQVPPTQARRSRSGVDPAYEIGRRLERLERRNAHPASPLGVNTDVDGVLGGTYEEAENTGWSQSVSARDIGETTGDSAGWGAATGVKQFTHVPVQSGWAGRTVPVLQPPVIEAASGWTASAEAMLAEMRALSTDTGWSEAVTFRDITTTSPGETQGWGQQTSFRDITDTAGSRGSWTGRVSVREITLDGGLSVDADVPVAGAALSVDADVPLGDTPLHTDEDLPFGG